MSTPIWLVEIIKKSFPARFYLSQLTQKSDRFGRMVNHLMFSDDEMIFLPKDSARMNASVTIHVGEAVPNQEEVILPSQVVKHYIDQANKLWIMDKCICRESDGCQDYPIDLGCLFLGDAVQGINPGLGHMVSREEAHAHINRAAEAGLVHVIGRNRLDTIWLGIGPSEKLMTICSCCPCCCLYKILPHLSTQISSKYNRMPGVEVEVNSALCIGCGVCGENICFVDAIHIENGKAVISSECRACGRCAEICPQKAIRLVFQDGASVRDTIKIIGSRVDVT
jgi:ferredoxin